MRPSALRTLENAGLAVLAIAVLVASALYLREEARGGPWRMHVLVTGAESESDHPRIARFLMGYASGDSALLPGDRLVRVGERSLTGANPWETYAALYAAAGPDGSVEIVAQRGTSRIVSRERLAVEAHVWRDAALAFAFSITALLLLWRAPGSPAARAFAAAALVWALAQIQFQGASTAQSYMYFAVRAFVGCLWAPLMLLAAVQFPDGVWPRDRPLPRWPWVFAALGVTWVSVWSSFPIATDLALRANSILGSATIAAIMVVLLRNYQRVGAVGRRQMKWVFIGCYLGLAPSLVGTLFGLSRPENVSIWYASQVALIAIPISILIALSRTNLFDVDRLITATASYTVVLVALGVLILTALTWMADEASELAGVDSGWMQIALAVPLAFVFVRLEPQLRPRLERLFFAERHAFQTGVDRLVSRIVEAPDATVMTETLGEGLDDLVRPDFIVVYARGSEAFAPVFIRRCSIRPHFDVEGGLATALAERISAVDLEREQKVLDACSAEERASLRGLGPAVLVPIVRNRLLVAIVALGRKASEDVYTPTDLALLGMVAAGVVTSMTRFGDEQLLRESSALQERLRQYVPASIAARITEGRDLEAGEREISILFADLRGYATLAEGRRAAEVFDVVSHYTEAVTRVVTEHGGTVVEFNGDGMMAIFGAPDPLPDKERRALGAARRIVSEVSALRDPEGGRLVVGVGLATGSAYVGSIRSVDRYIWSAIGNATNLAARLQSLTRELETSIVMDAETHRAADPDAVDFQCLPATSIRGLSAAHDVFMLPAEQYAVA